ncbi:MAG: hypothetical protein K1X89_28925 [Myxococcaceae bacterium]|nr:hypothetical protein [Myxococcaceae bacterium]
MGMAILGLSGLISIVNLVAFIIVLIQLFKAKGAGHGIAGLCCGLYTLIWGWQNADALDANNPPVIMKYKQWMMIWTACIAVNIVLNIMMRAVR